MVNVVRIASLPDLGPPERLDLRPIMRRHVAGVAVVTTCAGGPAGFTATSLTSVSLDPPLVSFAVALTSRSWSASRANQRGIIHLIDEGQADVGRLFAQSSEEKFGGAVPWRWTTERLPRLDGVMAWMIAEPRTRVIAGDPRSSSVSSWPPTWTWTVGRWSCTTAPSSRWRPRGR